MKKILLLLVVGGAIAALVIRRRQAAAAEAALWDEATGTPPTGSPVTSPQATLGIPAVTTAARRLSPTHRSPPVCARGRSTSSWGRVSCSAPGRRCGARSRRAVRAR